MRSGIDANFIHRQKKKLLGQLACEQALLGSRARPQKRACSQAMDHLLDCLRHKVHYPNTA